VERKSGGYITDGSSRDQSQTLWATDGRLPSVKKYRPDSSFHSDRIEAGRELTTPIYLRKTRARKDYSQGKKENARKNRKKGWKNADFLDGCGNRR